MADSTWVKYESPTGIYTVQLPKKFNVIRHIFVTAEDRSAHSEEIAAILDQRPYKNTVKSYIVKIDQTIGPALQKKEKQGLLEQEIDFYTDYYTSLGGEVKSIIEENRPYVEGSLLHMTYNDPEFGEQATKIRVHISDYTKIQQIISGPVDLMRTYKTKEYLYSLRFNTGLYNIIDENADRSWKPTTSPSKLFTVYLPQKTPPFFTTDPKVSEGKDAESIVTVFRDPVRNHSLFFNSYGYILDKNITYKDAHKVLATHHISKHKSSASGISFKKTRAGDVPVIEAEYEVSPPTKFPFLDTVKLRGLFLGKYMMVQEIMSSRILADSDFATALTLMVDFHPKKMLEAKSEPMKEEVASDSQATPESQNPDEVLAAP